jgi:hypothetical protein
MFPRRQFLKASLASTVSLTARGRTSRIWAEDSAANASIGYEIARHVPTRLFDGERCWCHPRAGVVPGAGDDGLPRVAMTMNTMHLAGSDVFKGMYSLETNDLGEHWTEPQLSDGLAPRYEEIDGVRRPVAVSDFWPTWHAVSGQLLGTGHTVVYTRDWRVTLPRPRHTSYSVYDPANSNWAPWRKLEMPADEPFGDAGAGCTQRVDLADGSILLPFYFRPPEKNSRVAVMHCTFDGQTLRYQEHGNVLTREDETRGLHEPSLAHFDDEFFLTIRNDKLGFVTRSRDGLRYEPIQDWRFDDDKPLGSYNTQQHWVTHTDALFLVYTRRGANNDHVFRQRAPLFMAQVDPERLRVIRSTERVLVPERGARLGNFGVTQVSPQETWVTVSEWMQPKGIEKYGSDGSVFVARILWDKPNV